MGDVNPKSIVETGYDRCADSYESARSPRPSAEIVDFARRLARGSAALDIGCGSGIPIARFLASTCEVTGIDISSRQIALCRKNVPTAHLIHGDVMKQKFSTDRFDAILAMYSLFHLPRSEHEDLIGRIASWLKIGGLAFVSVAKTPEKANVESDFFGSPMYWSSHTVGRYRDWFESSGLRILETGSLGHGFSEDLEMPEEVHPYFLLERVS